VEYREQTKQGEIRAFVEGSDYKSTREASLNLIYSPTANITMGVEFLWGETGHTDQGLAFKAWPYPSKAAGIPDLHAPDLSHC
jgi:hypothetical protein